MIISSEAPPMAYVLSSSKTSPSNSCTSVRLFKFDPSSFSENPNWTLSSKLS